MKRNNFFPILAASLVFVALNLAVTQMATATSGGGGGDHCSGGVCDSDLSLEKTVNVSEVLTGQALTFTLTVSSIGHDGCYAEVVDLLPVGLVFSSASPTQGSYDDSTGLWSVDWLADGSAASMDLVAVVSPGWSGQTIFNSATAHVLSSGPSGSFEYYDVDLANNVASVPVHVVPEPASALLLCLGLLGTVAMCRRLRSAISSRRLVFGLAVVAVVIAVNLGEVRKALAVNPIPDIPADLSLEKTVNVSKAQVGQLLRFTLTLTNLGPNDTEASVLEQLPEGFTATGADTEQGIYDPAFDVWVVGLLSAGQSTSMELFAIIEPGWAGQTIVNTATASVVDVEGFLYDPDLTNNSFDALVHVVPEPATGLLLGPGLLAAAARCRRRLAVPTAKRANHRRGAVR